MEAALNNLSEQCPRNDNCKFSSKFPFIQAELFSSLIYSIYRKKNNPRTHFQKFPSLCLTSDALISCSIDIKLWNILFASEEESMKTARVKGKYYNFIFYEN